MFIFAISSSTSKSLPVQGDVGIIASLALYLSSCGPGTIWGQVRLSVSLTGGLTPPPYQLVPAGSFTNLSTRIAVIFFVNVKVKHFSRFFRTLKVKKIEGEELFHRKKSPKPAKGTP